MTDGGQIGDNVHVFAEQNHSQTVTTLEVLGINKLILGNNDKQIKVSSPTKKGIITINSIGQVVLLPIPDIINTDKLLATDNDGNLIWVDKEE